MEKPELPLGIKKILDTFVESLKSVYNNDLVSVMLYGSATRPGRFSRRSNINIAVILNNAGLSSLSRMKGLMKNRSFMDIDAIFFTESYLENSLDVFPIEFLDMKESRVVLYGKDPLKDVQIDLKNLRFQCEHEIKSKIINIKKFYISNQGNKAALKVALFKLFTSSVHLFRNLIRIKGCAPADSRDEMFDELAREFSIDASVLKRISAVKEKRGSLSAGEVEDLLFALVGELEKAAEAVG